MKPYNESKLNCVNMEDRKVVFETPAYAQGAHTHHWLKLEGKYVLSVQSSKNVVKFFEVTNDGKQFTENESLRITLPDSDTINYCEFDKKLENVYVVKNENILEKRVMSGDYGVVMSMMLEQSVTTSFGIQQLSLSDDGNWCAIAGGLGKKYWYLVDNVNGTQFKIESKVMSNSCSSCFIGGGSERVVIGGRSEFEVWDINTRTVVQHITGLGDDVNCMVSVGNILAVGTENKMLSLYDVSSWKVIYSKKYGMDLYSLHLTADQKYLTVAGDDGEGCVVLK